MRLVDADEFKKQIAGMAIINGYPTDKANKICELIDLQPTTYDIDKVIEQLETRRSLLKVAKIPKSARSAADTAYSLAIGDIRKGGIVI